VPAYLTSTTLPVAYSGLSWRFWRPSRPPTSELCRLLCPLLVAPFLDPPYWLTATARYGSPPTSTATCSPRPTTWSSAASTTHYEPHSPRPPTRRPPSTTRTPTHGPDGFVRARRRHAAPSVANMASKEEVATLTCAESGSVHTFGGGVTCADDGVRPRAARSPAPRQPPGWRARARP
jgi:hypothetical protein